MPAGCGDDGQRGERVGVDMAGEDVADAQNRIVQIAGGWLQDGSVVPSVLHVVVVVPTILGAALLSPRVLGGLLSMEGSCQRDPDVQTENVNCWLEGVV